MELERKHLCPLLKKKCIGLDCEWFIKVSGTDPQNKDREIEEWGCAVNFIFLGQLEVAKRVSGGLDGVQKATENFRDEMIDLNKAAVIEEAAALPPPKEITLRAIDYHPK